MTSIRILSVGKSSDAAVEQLQAEYEKRLSRWVRIDWRLISPGTSTKSESQAILSCLRPTDFVVLLDERGIQPDNQALVRALDLWLSSGKRVTCIIGGAYGVDATVHDRANYTLSISSLVFPHQLMRVLLLEQLYRTFNLRDGGKYHHS